MSVKVAGICVLDGCTKPPKDNYRLHCAMHLSRYGRYGSYELPKTIVKNCCMCKKDYEIKTSSFNSKYCKNCRPVAETMMPSYKKWEKSSAGKAYMRKFHVVHKNKLKQQVYDYYGWRCNCCAEDTVQFLSIDHVNNDGHLDRKQKISGVTLLKKIIDKNYPADYQILCMNCNFGKKITGGICPHQM